MEAYSSILQFIAIFVIVLIVFSFFRLLVSVARSKRIEDFAISSHNEGLTFEQWLYKIVYWLSEFIEELVIFNNLASPYEKYVAMGDNKFKKGMDFIALKTLFGTAMALMYVIWAFIFNAGIGLLLVDLSFFIGSIVPDIYYKLRYYRNNTDIVDDLLRAVIIINNSFRANRGVEQALNDVIERLDGP